MRRGTMRLFTLLVLAVNLLSLAGCSSHDRAWDVESDTPAGPGHTKPAPAPPPPAREIVITVSPGGAIACRQDGISIAPLTAEQLARNESADNGSHLVIIDDVAHEKERCFPVGMDLDSIDVRSQGGSTLRHVGRNLVIDVQRATRITLFARDSQVNIDECVAFAADNDVDRLAGRLNSDPALINGRESKTGRTPLAQASEAGSADAVAFLLDRKANTEIKDDKGFAPLHLAVRRGRFDIVRILVRHGADVNAKTEAGDTPMHLALSHNYTDIAAFLAGAGADSNVSNGGGKTPMQVALDKIFELNREQTYGPFDDGSSIRYAGNRLYVQQSGRVESGRWEEFDLPASRETWISLEGTNFLVMVRGRGRYRVWARYHNNESTTSP